MADYARSETLAILAHDCVLLKDPYQQGSFIRINIGKASSGAAAGTKVVVRKFHQRNLNSFCRGPLWVSFEDGYCS